MHLFKQQKVIPVLINSTYHIVFNSLLTSTLFSHLLFTLRCRNRQVRFGINLIIQSEVAVFPSSVFPKLHLNLLSIRLHFRASLENVQNMNCNLLRQITFDLIQHVERPGRVGSSIYFYCYSVLFLGRPGPCCLMWACFRDR